MPNLEIEKKYLIDELPPFVLERKYSVIEQYYFGCPTDTGEVRVRCRDGIKYFTFKSYVKEGIKNEYEFILTQKQYEKLRNSCPNKPIIKRRYEVGYTLDTSLVIEVDIFQGDLEGLIVAEIELHNEEDLDNFIPELWFSNDITGDYEYHNCSLAYYGKPKKLTFIEKIRKLITLWKKL